MAGIGSRGLGGAFPQKILKFISREMLFCAFSWKHFLIKKINSCEGQNARNFKGLQGLHPVLSYSTSVILSCHQSYDEN